MVNFNDVYSHVDDTSYYGKASSVLRKHKELINFDNTIALDLGCGDGRNSVYVAEHGMEVISVDKSNRAIKKLKEQAQYKNLKINAISQNILNINFNDSSFDLIIASTILDHLENNCVNLMFDRIKRWIKDNGIIYIGVFTVEDSANTSNNLTSGPTSEHIKTFFDLGELKNKFYEENYKILFYEEILKEDLSHGDPHMHGLARILLKVNKNECKK